MAHMNFMRLWTIAITHMDYGFNTYGLYYIMDYGFNTYGLYYVMDYGFNT